MVAISTTSRTSHASSRLTWPCPTRLDSAAPTARSCCVATDVAGGRMLVARPLPAGLDLLDVHRLSPQRYPLLLESSATGTAQGRWDVLLATSGQSLLLAGDGLTRRDD